MSRNQIIIIILIIIVIFIFINNKSEHAGSTPPATTPSIPNLSAEAIQNIAKIYADSNNTAIFNNIRATGKITGDVSGNVAGKLMSNDGAVSLYLNTDKNLIVSNSAGEPQWNFYGYIKALNKLTSARYIRVGNNIPSHVPRQDYWNIREIIVLDSSGTNIALNKPVTITVGSAWNNNPSSNVVNGNIPFSDTEFYSGNTGANELEIDLGKEYNDISQIIIYNRWNYTLYGRADNTSVQLLDKDKKLNRIIFTGSWSGIDYKEYIL
jgi:hypothetical protein